MLANQGGGIVSSDKLALDSESLDDFNVPIFVKNTSGVYVYCNRALVEFLGLSEKKIIGHSAFDIAPARLAEAYANAQIRSYFSLKKISDMKQR